MAHLNRRAKVLTAMLATAALFVTACGSSDDTSDAAGGADGAGNGTIISGVAYATTNYHPSSTSSALAMGTNWHVVEGLYEQDLSDYSVYKALAAEDEPTEISDTEYEISIREAQSSPMAPMSPLLTSYPPLSAPWPKAISMQKWWILLTPLKRKMIPPSP